MKGSSGAVKFLLVGVVVSVFVLMAVGQANANSITPASISFIEQGASVLVSVSQDFGSYSTGAGSEYAWVTGYNETYSGLSVVGLLEPGGGLSDVVAAWWVPTYSGFGQVIEGWVTVAFLSDLDPSLPSPPGLEGLVAALTTFTCRVGSCFDETGQIQTVIDNVNGLTVMVQSDAPAAVPEPSSLLLLGSGLSALGIVWRRRQRK